MYKDIHSDPGNRSHRNKELERRRRDRPQGDDDVIFNCKAPGCDFSAFNEKALELHKKEKHRVASMATQKKEEVTPLGTPGTAGTAGITQNEKLQGEKPQETHTNKPHNNKPGLNFLIDLKGKNVGVEGKNGKKITGVLKRYNQYELLLETDTGLRTLFKHALFMIYELKID